MYHRYINHYKSMVWCMFLASISQIWNRDACHWQKINESHGWGIVAVGLGGADHVFFEKLGCENTMFKWYDDVCIYNMIIDDIYIYEYIYMIWLSWWWYMMSYQIWMNSGIVYNQQSYHALMGAFFYLYNQQELEYDTW